MWLPVTSTHRAYGTTHARHRTTPSPLLYSEVSGTDAGNGAR
jgi:hypothetical protein